MKKFKNLLLGTLTTIILFIVNIVPVFADGGVDPYSPYKPHNPIDTGIGNLEDIVLIGAVLYTAGVALLAYSKIIKKKFLK